LASRTFYNEANKDDLEIISPIFVVNNTPSVAGTEGAVRGTIDLPPRTPLSGKLLQELQKGNIWTPSKTTSASPDRSPSPSLSE
jgi:hypothetical protein